MALGILCSILSQTGQNVALRELRQGNDSSDMHLSHLANKMQTE